MSSPYAVPVVVGAGFGYLAFFFFAVNTYSYDIWGALVVVPPLFLLGAVGMLRMFRGELAPLAPIMIAGLAAKFVGAGARYWVGFDVYSGVIDAQGYHVHGRGLATAVWDGNASFLTLIPIETGTPFIEVFTGFVYYFAGTSRLGGFMVFAWLAYWGTAWFVKAAAVAVPGLLQRRYAVLCVVAPSLVYWPSSIGKDAWMLLTLGLATYGFALLLAGRGLFVPVAVSVLGLLGAAMVRPHLSGLWIAGLMPALLIGVLASRTAHGSVDGEVTRRQVGSGERILLLGVIAIAAVGLAAAAGTTVRYLNPNDEEGGTQAVTSILDETTRRTTAGGSNFEPPSTSSAANWPVAVARTLTRPLLFEARGLAQLIAAAEMTAFLALVALSYKRVRGLPRLLLQNRYLVFGMVVLFLGGLAFSSFANLGILTRQKSILFPFLLLLPCLPLVQRVERTPGEHDDDTIEDELVSAARRSSATGFAPGTIRSSASWKSHAAWEPARLRTHDVDSAGSRIRGGPAWSKMSKSGPDEP